MAGSVPWITLCGSPRCVVAFPLDFLVSFGSVLFFEMHKTKNAQQGRNDGKGQGVRKALQDIILSNTYGRLEGSLEDGVHHPDEESASNLCR